MDAKNSRSMNYHTKNSRSMNYQTKNSVNNNSLVPGTPESSNKRPADTGKIDYKNFTQNFRKVRTKSPLSSTTYFKSTNRPDYKNTTMKNWAIKNVCEQKYTNSSKMHRSILKYHKPSPRIETEALPKGEAKNFEIKSEGKVPPKNSKRQIVKERPVSSGRSKFDYIKGISLDLKNFAKDTKTLYSSITIPCNNNLMKSSESPLIVNNKTIHYETSSSHENLNGIVKAFSSCTTQGISRNYNEDRVSMIFNAFHQTNYKKSSSQGNLDSAERDSRKEEVAP